MTQHTTGNRKEAEGNEKRALVDGILLAGREQRRQQRLEAQDKRQEVNIMTQPVRTVRPMIQFVLTEEVHDMRDCYKNPDYEPTTDEVILMTPKEFKAYQNTTTEAKTATARKTMRFYRPYQTAGRGHGRIDGWYCTEPETIYGECTA